MTGGALKGSFVTGFNTPEGVEGFSSRRLQAPPRVLEDGQMVSFNTPEGVEGFSSS